MSDTTVEVDNSLEEFVINRARFENHERILGTSTRPTVMAIAELYINNLDYPRTIRTLGLLAIGCVDMEPYENEMIRELNWYAATFTGDLEGMYLNLGYFGVSFAIRNYRQIEDEYLAEFIESTPWPMDMPIVVGRRMIYDAMDCRSDDIVVTLATRLELPVLRQDIFCAIEAGMPYYAEYLLENMEGHLNPDECEIAFNMIDQHIVQEDVEEYPLPPWLRKFMDVSEIIFNMSQIPVRPLRS
jgi:hypothetical protein